MERAIAALSNVLAFAIAFIASPQLAGMSNEWAVGYMDDNYGAWLSSIGGFFWFVIVALLTFFISKVVLMTVIKVVQFYGLLSAGR